MSSARSTLVPVGQSEKTIYLLDANILLRLAQPGHAMHATARDAVRTLLQRSEQLVTAPQSLWEFWTVATRPPTARGGLGLDAGQAQTALQYFEALYPALPEVPLHYEWTRLVVAYGVCGKDAHDARLVALLKAHGLSTILTFNTKDFARYALTENIVAIDPAYIK